MSVFFYLACEEHETIGPVLASLNIGGWQRGDPQHEFLARHWQCATIRVIDEYDALHYVADGDPA